jgi:hypothetical protein
MINSHAQESASWILRSCIKSSANLSGVKVHRNFDEEILSALKQKLCSDLPVISFTKYEKSMTQETEIYLLI